MMDLDCQKARGSLHGYLSAELEPGEASRVEAHLRSCPDCTARLGRWRSFRSAVRRAGQTEPVPPLLRARVLERLRSAPQPGRLVWGLFPARWAVAAALLCISLGLGSHLLSRLAGSASPAAPVAVRPAAVAARPAPHAIRRVDAVLASILQDQDAHSEVASADDQSPADQSTILATFTHRVGRDAVVPRTLERYRRKQCHLCPVGATSYPLVQYRDGRKTLSLFLVPAGELRIDGRKAVRLKERDLYCTTSADENLVAWRQGRTVYVLISQQPRAAVVELASAFPPGAP